MASMQQLPPGNRQATSSLKLPHNFNAIMKHSDIPLRGMSIEKLYDRLNSGVFLDQKRKMYWVDAKSGNNCFMLYARDLLITGGDDKRYWQWTPTKEGSNTVIDVAELKNISRLEVCGNFDTSNLSPGIMYEFAFVVMLKDSARGWEVPVNLVLGTPDGESQEHIERLQSKPKGQWVALPVGEFLTSEEDEEEVFSQEVDFSLYEIEGGNLKSGLVIKGVVIRPKNSIKEKPNNIPVEEKPSNNFNVSSGNNQLTMTAKDLYICWAEDKRYWRWNSLKDSSNVSIDMVELLNVPWLEVKGKYTTSKLRRGITYEVLFVVVLKDPSYGWEVPVNLLLELPNGERKERKESLLSMPKGKWVDLKVGEFKTDTGNAGKIQFSLLETEGKQWKKGLVIKGVIIRPKNEA